MRACTRASAGMSERPHVRRMPTHVHMCTHLGASVRLVVCDYPTYRLAVIALADRVLLCEVTRMGQLTSGHEWKLGGNGSFSEV